MIGIDILEVKRMKSAHKRWGKSFLNKIFTSTEQKASEEKSNQEIFFASRFAAKEAVYKALPRKLQLGVRFTDIEIQNTRDGRPIVMMRRDNVFRQMPGLQLSISHCKKYAVASAVFHVNPD